MAKKQQKDSEYRAYIFIENSLKEIGWNIKNPNRFDDGEVYTQSECLNNDLIKEKLGKLRPENIVVIKTNTFWIIEAKRQHKQIEEAKEDGKKYCSFLNKTKILAPLFSIVVGDENNSFLVKNFYFKNGEWKEITINGKKTTGFLDRDLVRDILNNNNPNIQDYEIPDEIYYQKAIKINEILHNGSINKHQRARVVSTILLALLKDAPINRDNECFTLIGELNLRAEGILAKKNKRDFKNCISITMPPTPDNHIKFRGALLKTIQELDSINIKSAMNSGTDILGRFYEQFLKYGNGSKEIGIVLTPRHITNFAVDVLDVSDKDKVLDPACGTGGFLVSSFNKVKSKVGKEELEKFKKEGIYGIEQDSEVLALALVNMIFRGDGKTNIEEGNCFTTEKFNKLKVSKVLMNPPFALKRGDEKEYKFIDFGLEKIEKGGYLFAIIPSPIMLKNSSLSWRKILLDNHTLKAVVKLPEDLFYPVSVHTSFIIIQKGIPHNNGNVFWSILNDGFIKKKGVMIKKYDGTIENIKNSLKSYLNNIPIQDNEICCLDPIENNKCLECTPENYLPEKKYKSIEIYSSIKDTVVEIISYCLKRNNKNIFVGIKKLLELNYNPTNFECITDIFDICTTKSLNIEDYGIGNIPFVTSTTLNNAVQKYIEPAETDRHFSAFNITISSFGNAYLQVENFVARSHGAILVLKPKKNINLSLQELLFYTACLNLQKWRFSYGRFLTETRLKKLKLQNIDIIDLKEIKYIFNKTLEIIQ